MNPPSPTNLALAVLVLIVIVHPAGFSAFQDWSTSHTMKSITYFHPSDALVIRDGRVMKLRATELVSSNIASLQISNKLPADMRIIGHSLIV
ncbi:hypothetical protein V8C35DRAFT_296009 [Trichoderma chlorosporum]